jgi:hypothetical protein
MNINEAFASAARVLFKKEVGQLDDFTTYLDKHSVKLHTATSASGKKVYYTAPYAADAPFISFDEAQQDKKPKHLDLDDIKDIDSIVSAVKEIGAYTGNKVLGNSKQVAESEVVIDSSIVYRSSEIIRCEYIAFSSLLRDSKYMFGCCSGGDNEFCIRCDGVNQSKRCFESSVIFYCSDTYYSNNCKNCQEVFFSFDQQQKKYLIGNNSFERERYLELKKNLLEQIANELTSKKLLPSLVDFYRDGKYG